MIRFLSEKTVTRIIYILVALPVVFCMYDWTHWRLSIFQILLVWSPIRRYLRNESLVSFTGAFIDPSSEDEEDGTMDWLRLFWTLVGFGIYVSFFFVG